MSLPAPTSRAGSLFGILPDCSLHVRLLAQSPCWEHTDGSGKVGPMQAGLGQLNRVNSRHLPGHQQKGSWVHPGEVGLGERQGGLCRKVGPPSSPCSSALGTHHPLGAEPPPRQTHGFCSLSSSIIMDRQVLKLTLCKTQSSSGPATAPPGSRKEVSRFWDDGWPAPASKPVAGLVLLGFHTCQHTHL